MTRLDLLRSYTATLTRRQLGRADGLAIILMAGRTEGITRADYLASSGLSSTRVRRVLDGLVGYGLATRETGARSTPQAHIPHLYKLTTQGEAIARELIALSTP